MQGPALKEGDTVVYSAAVASGRSRPDGDDSRSFLIDRNQVHMGVRQGVHVSNHASREELKFMLSITNPKYFDSRSG